MVAEMEKSRGASGMLFFCALWKCNSPTGMGAICSAVRHAERRGADGGCGKMGLIIPSAADEGTARPTLPSK